MKLAIDSYLTGRKHSPVVFLMIMGRFSRIWFTPGHLQTDLRCY